MNTNDFQLRGIQAVNQLIHSVFGSQGTYFDGDTRAVAAKPPHVKSHQFYAKAYLDLIISPGRNEPDDRLFTIEVIFGDLVPLSGSLLAIALPHTLWSENDRAPWIESLAEASIEIIPYDFVPGRPPEHYHTLLERAVKSFYETRKFL